MPRLADRHDSGLVSGSFQLPAPYAHIKTIITIHNLKYQGVFDKEAFKDYFALGDEHLHGYALELHGGASFLKGGLLYSDYMTTVSPTYAEEIQTPYYGECLDGLLRSQNHRLQGIINGLDYEEFDPMADPNLEVRYRDSYPKKTAKQAEAAGTAWPARQQRGAVNRARYALGRSEGALFDRPRHRGTDAA